MLEVKPKTSVTRREERNAVRTIHDCADGGRNGRADCWHGGGAGDGQDRHELCHDRRRFRCRGSAGFGRRTTLRPAHGNMVAGKKIEMILRDDAGVADNARRLVQEMIVNDKVHIIAGGITPTALAYGQLVTQAKIATVVMISGASVTTTASPYFVRTSFILAQSSWIMGEWAAKNGSKRVVTLVNEWAPGTEAETAFKQRFTELGGQIVESIRIP